MASPDFDPDASPLPPPRPTTPPVRRGFLRVLAALVVITTLAYGVPFAIDRAGYAYEAGRSRAAAEGLARLDDAGVLERSSALFRMATQVITPAVVSIRTVIVGQTGGQEEIGSGVVIDKANGYIVTNEHVVRDAGVISVRVGRSRDMEATLVGFDARTDLAVIKVKGPLGVQAEWGDSSRAEVGQWVLAVGIPFNLDRTVTLGIVSATGRRGISTYEYQDYLQTDAAINPGNSGGPLVDLRGRVLGINTAIINPVQGQGIGFAISEEIARKVSDQIIRNGKVVRAYLGVVPARVPPGVAEGAGLSEGQEGAMVGVVRPESPAAKAGIRPGDIIVGLDGRQVADPGALRTQAFTLPIGSDVPLEFYRDGKKRSVIVKVEAMPESILTARSLGFEVGDAPRDSGPGVVVTAVAPDSPAQDAGLRPGMRVVAVGTQPILNRNQFDSSLVRQEPAQGLPLRVFTDNRVELITVNPPGRARP